MNWLDCIEAERSIGRRNRDPVSDALVRGGSAGGLHFSIEWDASQPNEAVGTLHMYVGTSLVWGDGDRGIRADLAPMLNKLARSWDFLVLQQGYPRGVTPASPSMARRAYVKVVAESYELVWPIHDDLNAFEANHNLAGWSAAELGSDLWIVREGGDMVLQSRDTEVRWPFHDVVRTLTLLGDAIAKRLKDVGTRDDAVSNWESRDGVQGLEALALSLGMPLADVHTLVDQQIVSMPATREDLVRDMDEMRAAARMLGSYIDTDDLAVVARTVSTVPLLTTQHLDALSRRAEDVLVECEGMKPFEQGQHLALWLRKELDQNQEGMLVEPDDLLERWGVDFRAISLAPTIEAISVWGPSHGPSVMLNSLGRRSREAPGYAGISGGGRATLAHEICHLLVDRGTALPVAEVFGGATPKRLEQRANAFGAEFLVPMTWAIGVYRNSADVSEALFRITENYRVTRSLAAQQLLNYGSLHPGALTREDAFYLQRVVGRRY